MIEKYYEFTCDDENCKRVIGRYKNKDAAKAHGWAIGHGEKKCYCPSCAFRHRNTGCGGVKNKISEGQITISEVQSSA